MNDSKYHSRAKEDKFNKYKKDIQNERMFLFKIKQLFTDEYEEIFDDILILNENQFISQLKNRVESELEETYSDKIFSERKFSSALEKGLNNLKTDYKSNFDLINNAYYLFSKNKNTKKKNIEFLISQYRRHCINEVENEFATHTCNARLGKFILVKNYGKIEFVICSNCKKVYYSNMILCKCYKCNKEYYTEILSKNDDEFILPATWENYHCKQIANEKIKCIKCHEDLFINMKTKMLVCQNKKCNFSSKPSRILWTCSICQEDFKSGAIPYNPLDLLIIKKIIKQTLYQKQKAHPYKVPCCKLNVFFTEFYHKKKCNGILYSGELNDDIIIVCDKCHAINFYDRFIWTCPKCGNKFKDEKDDKELSISEESSDFSGNIFHTISNEGRKKHDSILANQDSGNNNEENSSYPKIYKPRVKFSENSKRSYVSQRREANNNTDNQKDNKYKSKKESNENNSEKNSTTIEFPRTFKKLYSSRYRRTNDIDDKDDNNDNNNDDNNNNKIKEKDKNNEKKQEDIKEEDKSTEFKKYRRLRYYTEIDNSKKHAKEKEEKEKEQKTNILENKKVEKATFNVFAKYRNRRRMEEKEEKERKEREENEKKKKKEEKEREEREKREKEKEERERREKEKREKREQEREERERKEREKKEKEREERERREREEREERERREREKREKREKREREEKERREREEKEREEREEKLRKEKEKEKEDEEVKYSYSNKRIGAYRSFKRALEKNDNNEKNDNFEFASSRGLQKVQKRDIKNKSRFNNDTNKSERNNTKKENKLEEEEEVEEEDTQFKSKDKDKIEEESQNEPNKEENAPCFNRHRWKFRRPEAKKTYGKVIKEETESTNLSNENNTNKANNISNEENSNTNSHEDNSHKNKNNNSNNNTSNNVFVNPITKIPGISDNLLNHLNKRISNIVSKCSIPLMNVEDYILYRKIGEGSYGIIFSVINKKDKKQYALKKIISNKLKQIGEFTKEFELVHSCEHENIMKIYNFCIRILDPTTYALYVLMELSEGDWDKEIKKKLKQRKNYSESELINILYQLTSALLYIQEKYHISHRDIKPQNVLVFADGKYKLADFGEAKEAKVSRQINTLRGTELYMSPALYDGLKNEKNDVSHNPFKSDVFSLGFCFLYASALNFNLLYEVRDILDSRTINVILHKFLNKFYSEKLIQLLASMLEIDEAKRYDFSTIKTYLEKNYPELNKKEK